MDIHLFESFSKIIETIPPKGLVKAVETQCRMIEDDLSRKRTLPVQDAGFILALSRFLNAAFHGTGFSSSEIPLNHLPTCRRVIERLVEAGELPVSAEEQFNRTFSKGFLYAAP